MANGRPWAAYNESPLTGRVKGGFILANYTEHYGLHQWVPEDDFLRTDFNTDFALIDAALAGLAAADGAESQTRSQEDGELSAAITAGDNAQASALASAKTALQNAITSGDNAQASALAAAKTALQNSITTGDNAQAAALATAKAELDAAKAEMTYGSYVGTGATEHTITLGFQPKFMLILAATPQESHPENDIMFIFGSVARYERSGEVHVAPEDSGSGLILYSATPTAAGIRLYSVADWEYPALVMNEAGVTYQYFAVT